ncbi:MAG: insulinase family protein [Candidatus Sericytochromatia bacterium]
MPHFRTLLLTSCLFLVGFLTPVSAATLPPLESTVLPNGLQVLIVPDENASLVHANLLVKAGDLHERIPETAHLLEHLLFKGSDRLGTRNYAAEKPLLQRWNTLWQKYIQAPSSERAQWAQQMDALEQEQAHYLIPQELDQIYSALGIANNAFTGSSYTRFEAILPPARLPAWLALETERLRAPVFRQFRQEVQVVFNEKTDRLNDSETQLMNRYFEVLYPGHPLGQYRQALLDEAGLPNLEEVQRFFKTWYVPSNMVLILQGPLKLAPLKAELARTVGTWPAGPPPAQPAPIAPLPKTARLEVNAPGAPEIQFAWRLPFESARDQVQALMLQELLDSRVGLLNFVGGDRAIESAGVQVHNRGRELVFNVYASAMSTDLLLEAERELQQLLESVPFRTFHAEQIEAMRTNMELWLQKRLESPDERVSLIQEALVHGQSAEAWLNALQSELASVRSKDLQRLMDQLLEQPGVVVIKRPGQLPPLDQLSHPPALQTFQSSAMSPFGESLIRQAGAAPAPGKLVANRHYSRRVLAQKVPLYHAPNPYNSLFQLRVGFYLGDRENPGSCQLLRALNRVGSQDLPARLYQGEIYRLGGQELAVSCGPQLTMLELEGPDANLGELLELLTSRLEKPDLFPEILASRLQREEQWRASARSNLDEVHSALYNWLYRGKDSASLVEPPLSALNKQTLADYPPLRQELLKRLAWVEYSGSLSPQALEKTLLQNPLLAQSLSMAPPPRVAPALKMAAAQHDKAVQIVWVPLETDSNAVTLLVPGPLHRPEDFVSGALLAEYLGGQRLSGAFLRELRESRSLIYAGGVSYYSEERAGDQDSLSVAFQAAPDKTVAAIKAALSQLKYPGHSGIKLDEARTFLSHTWSGQQIGFRELPLWVRYWDIEQQAEDPLPQRWQQLKSLNERDFYTYLDQFLAGPKVIAITGQLSAAQRQELSQLGPMTTLSLDQIMR